MAYEDLDLDLTSVDSVVIVGDNGAGKSALLDIVLWTLYDRSRITGEGAATIDDHIRRGADGCMTRVEFDAGGHSYVVTREKPRGRTGTLNLTVDGSDRSTGHKQDETFARVAAMIGLNYAALIASTFMIQRSEGSFIEAKPAAAKDLLVVIAQLERFRPLWEAAKKERAGCDTQVGLALARVAEHEADLEGEDGTRATLAAARERLAAGQEAQALASDRITAAKVAVAQHSAAVKRHADVEERAVAVKKRLDAIDVAVGAVDARKARAEEYLRRPPVDDAAQAAANAEARRNAMRKVADLMQLASLHRTNNGELMQLASHRQQFERDIAAAERWEETKKSVPCGGEGIYATCRFLTASPTPFPISSMREEIAGIEVKVQGLQLFPTADAELEEARSWVATVERTTLTDEADARERARRTVEAKEASAEATAEAARLTDERVAVVAEQERLAAEQQAIEADFTAIHEAEAELQDAENVYVAVRDQLAAAERVVRAAEATVVVIDRARAQRDHWREAAAAAQQGVATYSLVEQAFHRDGIPTMVIERLVPRIEEEANVVLGRLPGDFAVNLRTQRLTGAGTLADTLDIVVRKGGDEEPVYMLSVGQRFRVDIALRLAIGRVLAHRSGSTIDTLWLDEPLADLDAAGREAVIETLAALGDEFGLVVVVSHHAEFSDRFPARIEVEQGDGVTSTARLTA